MRGASGRRRAGWFSVAVDLVWLVVFIVVVWACDEAGFLNPLDRLVIDTLVAVDPPRPADHTVIIDINDASFNGPFKRTSPLEPDLLAVLISAAIQAQARAIVVDIETNVNLVRSLVGAEYLQQHTPIVWARDAVPCPGTMCVMPIATPPAAAGTSDSYGIALLSLDGDGAVRRYLPAFNLAEGSGETCTCSEGDGPAMLSLPRAAVLAAQFEERPRSKKALLLNWRGERYAIPRLSADQVLKDWNKPWWGSAQPIRGRVVLIGGTFREARDVRWTPVGEMSGVEIAAQIVETEVNGHGGLAQLNRPGAIALEALLGIALICLNRRYRRGGLVRVFINAAAVLVLPLAATWFLHRFALYWVNLAPVLAGVALHQWWARSHD